MDRTALEEIATRDPAYAVALSAIGKTEPDDDRLYIEIGRGVMAVLELERRGWMLVRAEIAKD